ncbi:CTLH/CRA C-terminal to lish motif domain-containing protein [Podospora appendiculata]|uniref:CTLH/CRA C-terminal to lish motif domain-containing protein n=1 Tax=Podospora appendiculata TaxID=314037 RepID=A0AAE0XGB2_9PEZI|nr:CTLH/CRA C-terminal to lish motif domain-containing protein [Podospora appendiculata]
MADQEASKITHSNHLLLDQPLLRLPYELLRKNFRGAHFHFEKESSSVKNLLRDTATGSLDGKVSPDDVVKNLDAMLAKMRGMKRKLSAYAEEEAHLFKQVDARVAHLRELSDMQTVEDVKYEAWSRQRLDRLLVDYLLRHGYNDSAQSLASERQMEDLVDIDTFVAMSKIRKSLESGSVQEALAWCNDNKKELRRMNSNLEFMLRCQQYVEMMRAGAELKMVEATTHAKRYIVPFSSTYPTEVRQVAGLLAYKPDTTVEPYASWYSHERWTKLADIFVEAHNQLLGLPSFPLLHIALSSGLSALKTPACHSSQATSSSQPSHSTSLTTSVCPICSTELNELARNVPYAHHATSHVEHDLLLMPNGRVYGKQRLEEYAVKAGLPDGQFKDLVTGETFPSDKLKKVFIT